MIHYKVRNKTSPDLFHKGGVYENWSKVGKIWSSIGQLRSFITMNMNHRTDFSNWEIIEYEVIEKEVKQVHEVISTDKLVRMLTA